MDEYRPLGHTEPEVYCSVAGSYSLLLLLLAFRRCALEFKVRFQNARSLAANVFNDITKSLIFDSSNSETSTVRHI